MEISRNEILIYGAVAIIISIAGAYVLHSQLSQSYGVSVRLTNLDSYKSVYPYMVGHMSINITNTGQSTIKGDPLVVYMNGQAYTYRITLAPGQSGTIPFNAPYDYSGTYNFSAVFDPGTLLNVADRAAAQAALSVNVTEPGPQNPFLSIPNANATRAISFTLERNVTEDPAVLYTEYNLSFLGPTLGLSPGIGTKIYADLLGLITQLNGTYVAYSNGASAYSAWMQGPVVPAYISEIMSSYPFPARNVSVNGTGVTELRLGNTTSMCYYYSGGYTKLVEYSNDSKQGTCASIINASYRPDLARAINDSFAADKAFSRYLDNFFYSINSTVEGRLWSYTNTTLSGSVLVTNRYGTFLSRVTTNKPPLNITTTGMSCLGLSYSKGNTSACSKYILPANSNVTSIALINTTEITPAYNITMYSVVNSTQAIAAHQSATNLLDKLNVSGASLSWAPAVQSSCSLSNLSIGCRFSNYDYANSTATVNLTNNHTSSIVLNWISCYLPGVGPHYPYNSTIKAGQQYQVFFPCSLAPGPSYLAAKTSYTLTVNYTLSGRNVTDVGTLNVTSFR
ncbi:MAG: hypothetical protein KGH98_01730 [Candidatus Micrarchaeota archaeon]|nr:hypothetical protein [Candidatus Micrarchaeota archaeon]